MSELVYPASQGSSAPVAIVLALALAATVGVSAQSWDVKVAAKPAAGTTLPAGETTGPAEDGEGHSLLRFLADWATRERPANCASPAR
jgi:hypothetical protein